jgi:hypothetical protein
MAGFSGHPRMFRAHVGVLAERKGEQIVARAEEQRDALEAWG